VAAWVLVALKNSLEILKNQGRSSIETQRAGKLPRGPKVVIPPQPPPQTTLGPRDFLAPPSRWVSMELRPGFLRISRGFLSATRTHAATAPPGGILCFPAFRGLWGGISIYLWHVRRGWRIRRLASAAQWGRGVAGAHAQTAGTRVRQTRY